MRKTDGSWSHAERNVYFLACNADQVEDIQTDDGLIHPYLLMAVNEINPAAEEVLERSHRQGARWFIDSGIFWLTNEHKRAHGISMDEALGLAPEEIDGFDALFARYVDILNRWKDRCWGYIELDQGGRENKIRTRTRLEKLGFNPIPVYHPFNDGWDYFDFLAERYDRICVGNVVQAQAPVRKRLVATMWERKQKYPKLWIHLLGLTPNQFLNAYPIDSGDSSSWLNVIRWSGYVPRAMLKAFGHMPSGYQYVVGDKESITKYRRKSVAMSAVGSTLSMRNWRNHLAALNRYGIEPFAEGMLTHAA